MHRATRAILTSVAISLISPHIARAVQLPSAPPPASADPFASIRDEIRQGAFTTAETHLRERLRADDADPDAHFLLGYVLFREHQFTASLAEYTAGARLRNPAPDDLLTVASDYILLKAPADAAHWLHYLTDRDPANATAWYLLGRTEYTEDRDADALAAFDRCLVLRPRDVRAEYNRGLALEKLQRPADALAAYDQAISWQAGSPAPDPQPWLDRGILLLAQNHAPEAVASLEQAAAAGPRNPLVQQELGRALEAVGRDQEAIAAFRRATVLAPTAERPHFFLGRLLRRLGQTAEANQEFAAAAELSGTHSGTETPNPDQ